MFEDLTLSSSACDVASGTAHKQSTTVSGVAQLYSQSGRTEPTVEKEPGIRHEILHAIQRRGCLCHWSTQRKTVNDPPYHYLLRFWRIYGLSSKNKSLFFLSSRGLLMGEPSADLDYLVALVDLLATCAEVRVLKCYYILLYVNVNHCWVLSLLDTETL